MNNVRFEKDEIGNAAIAIGTTILSFSGIVSLYMRSLSFLGLFFSFPLWSQIDPVSVLMMSGKERKRRKEKRLHNAKNENKSGRLGKLLDDDK